MATKKEISQNYRDGLEIVKAEYEAVFSRFKEMDNKLNMLLVFAAGEIAAFGATIGSFCDNLVFKCIYLSAFLIPLLLAIIFNFVGLFTRKLSLMNTNDMLDYVSCSSNKFIEDYVNSYNDCIDSIEKQINKKGKLFNASLICIFIALMFFCAGIITNSFLMQKI